MTLGSGGGGRRGRHPVGAGQLPLLLKMLERGGASPHDRPSLYPQGILSHFFPKFPKRSKALESWPFLSPIVQP